MKKHKLIIILYFIAHNVFSQLIINPAASLNYPRWGHESQVLPNGNVLAFGGDDGNLINNVIYKSAEIYTPSTNLWSVVNDMNFYRTNFASAVLNDGRILAIGGKDNNSSNLNTCEVYDYNTNTWTQVANLNEARSSHKAIRLNDGRILVVGGDINTNTAEIYDPYSNAWQYTDTLSKRHGNGISLASPGIVTGGSGANKSIESFSVISNSWSLVANNFTTGRSFHNSIVLGSRLAVFAGESTHKKTETWVIGSTFISNGGNLLTAVGDNKPILMDDGNALVYGIGDFSQPTNTKCLQILSASNYSWTAGTYNFTGADSYCINKLHDGRILINGGIFTTGNGSTTDAKLIGVSAYSNCVTPDLALSFNVINTCYGKTPTITVQSTQSGVNYEARIGENIVSLSSISGNGSNQNLLLNSSYITPGTNVVSVIAKKAGCPNLYLNNNAIITTSLSITETPTVVPNGQIVVCTGDSVLLTTSVGYSSYVWSNLSNTTTASSIYVKPNKFITVKYQDINGCTSISSSMIKVYTPVSSFAGTTQNTCSNQAPFQLTGNSPLGGTWSGPGISPSGTFSPAVVGSGSYTVTYSICSKTSNKVINVYPATVPSFSAAFTATSVCANQSTSLQIVNSKTGVKYQLRKGVILVGAAQNGTGGVLNFNTGIMSKNTTFNILSTITTTCSADTLITYHSMIVKPSFNGAVYPKDSLVCKGGKTAIIIDSSQAGVSYQILDFNSNPIYTPKAGDGDSIAIVVGPINTNSVFSVRASYSGCANITSSPSETINVQFPGAYFAPNKFNCQPNEYITFNNNSYSPGGIYTWNFDSNSSINSSTLTVPDSIYYSSSGSYNVKLKTISAIGCKDSLTQKVNVFNFPSTSDNCPIGQGAFRSVNSDIFSLTNDKNDNTYVISQLWNSPNILSFSKFNDTISQAIPYDPNANYGKSLIKYSKTGIPLWNVKMTHNSSISSTGNIECDSLGNIFFTYYHGSNIGKVNFYSKDNSFYSYSPPINTGLTYLIICKYSADGYFQWAKSYVEASASSSIKLDSKGYIYVGSGIHYKKFDSIGNLLWTVNESLRSIDADTLGNSYGLNFYGIYVNKYNSNGTLISSTQPHTNIGSASQVNSSHLKVDGNNAFMAGTFNRKIVFAGDTFNVNKDPNLNYPDGYIASSNIVTGQQKWFIQITFKTSFITLTGFDYKNGKGIITGYIPNAANDTLRVKNLFLPITSSCYFTFNFDSLGNVSNLINISSNGYIIYSSPKYLSKMNNTNSNSTIGTMYFNSFDYESITYNQLSNSFRNFAIIKGDVSCLTSIPTKINNISTNKYEQSVLVFPNPANSADIISIAVLSDTNERFDLMIYDVMGKQLGEGIKLDVKPGETTLNLPYEISQNLIQGVYFLQMQNKYYSKSVKLIIY